MKALLLLACTLVFAEGKPAWLLSKKKNEYVISKKAIEKEFKDPTSLLKSVTVKFVPGNEKRLFVELTDLKKGNALEPLGLKKGDVLKSVNGEGVSLTTFFEKKTPKAWLNQKRYELLLDRGGKEETLVFLVR